MELRTKGGDGIKSGRDYKPTAICARIFVSFTEVETEEFSSLLRIFSGAGCGRGEVQAEIFFRVEEYLTPSINN